MSLFNLFTDTISNGAARERGEQAKRILQDPMVVEGFALYEARLLKRWKASEDPAERQAIWASVRAIEGVQMELLIIMQSGQVAERIMEAEKEQFE